MANILVDSGPKGTAKEESSPEFTIQHNTNLWYLTSDLSERSSIPGLRSHKFQRLWKMCSNTCQFTLKAHFNSFRKSKRSLTRPFQHYWDLNTSKITFAKVSWSDQTKTYSPETEWFWKRRTRNSWRKWDWRKIQRHIKWIKKEWRSIKKSCRPLSMITEFRVP